MYAAIFAAGALGYGLNLLFLLIERRFRPLVREMSGRELKLPGTKRYE
jgi:hypothetical protein